ALRPPVGDAYARVESPKGELGFYLVSDGSTRPYRYKVRAPSFINLSPLGDMCRGHKVADVVVILGSIDIVMGEVDKEQRCAMTAEHDSKVIVVERGAPKLRGGQGLLAGLGVVIKHFGKALTHKNESPAESTGVFTVQYPEERLKLP